MKTWTKSMITGLLTGLVVLGSLPALAGPYNSEINRQEMEQERRIHQGVQSGRLSPGEFRRLENQQARIRATEARMRADGRLDRGEKAQLGRMQERASRDIYRSKHNGFGPAYYGPANCRPGSMRAGWR
jgi:hypothetical protein